MVGRQKTGPELFADPVAERVLNTVTDPAGKWEYRKEQAAVKKGYAWLASLWRCKPGNRALRQKRKQYLRLMWNKGMQAVRFFRTAFLENFCGFVVKVLRKSGFNGKIF